MDKDVIIRVEGLSKRYTLGAASNERYTALRDVVAQGARRLARRVRRVGGGGSSDGTAETDFWALRDVDFAVGRGEVVGIIGRNGAGKSTLLKILSRITEPTAGKITLRGRVASLLEVGTGFHPELTGRENIYLNGAILGMHRAEIKAKFDEIVAFAEVERFLDTPVKRYSSGMYVRLAFAVAAHLEPEILIVDEVLAVGDVEFQKKCLGKMQEVARGGGRTVLFVSHQMEAVQTLCHRCIYLQNGKVVRIGHSLEVVRAYLQKQSDNRGWLDREVKPTQFISITNFYVTSATGSTHIATGDDCRFVLEASSSKVVPQLRVAIGIDDKHGRRLFTLDSEKQNCTFNVMPGVNRFNCTVPSLPLKPDAYQVHLFIGNSYEAFDYINGDATLTVEATGSHDNMRIDESHGPISLPQEWT